MHSLQCQSGVSQMWCVPCEEETQPGSSGTMVWQAVAVRDLRGIVLSIACVVTAVRAVGFCCNSGVSDSALWLQYSAVFAHLC